MTMTATSDHASEPAGWPAVPTPSQSTTWTRLAWPAAVPGAAGWALAVRPPLRTPRPLGTNH